MTDINASFDRVAAAAVREPAAVASPSERIGLWQHLSDAGATVLAVVALGPSTTSVAFACAAAVALQATHAHRARIRVGVLDVAPTALRPLLIAAAMVLPLALAIDSVTVLVGMAVLTAALVLVGRALVGMRVQAGRRSGSLLESTVVIGHGQELERLTSVLRHDPSCGFQPRAFRCPVDDHRGDPVTLAREVHPDVGAIILTSDVEPSLRVLAALRKAVADGLDVFVQPRFAEVLGSESGDFELVHDVPLQRLRPHPLAQGGWVVKRACDIVTSLMALVVLSPVLLVAAIGVRLSSAGPILFRQARIGRDGEPFVMLKFRTFPVDHQDVAHSLTHDACPLRFGRFLRRTSIDELPQLWNVIRGDMSIIGPRPERPHFSAVLERSIPGFTDRHRVPGGITGLAQVHGFWGPCSLEDRVRLDNRYIDTWSLWADIRIMLRSPRAVLLKSRSSSTPPEEHAEEVGQIALPGFGTAAGAHDVMVLDLDLLSAELPELQDSHTG